MTNKEKKSSSIVKGISKDAEGRCRRIEEIGSAKEAWKKTESEP